MTDAQLAVSLISAVSLLLGGVITSRIGKAGAREHSIIDQLQEDLKAERAERTALAARVDDLWTRVQALTVRESLWEVHAVRVEAQVTALGGTPVARPAELC